MHRHLAAPALRAVAIAAFGCSLLVPARSPAQYVPLPGDSVNMVSGDKFPDGDPFLQRQNEPSIAVSSVNPQHILAGANDYRAVDIPVTSPTGSQGAITKFAADAWLGVFKSVDGGLTWKSRLLPGYWGDTSRESAANPATATYNAGADPVVRAGVDGMLYYSGIVFQRTANGIEPNAKGLVILSRFIDLNGPSDPDPIRYLDTKVITTSLDSTGVSRYFVDKPWIAVDVPRGTTPATCTFATDASGNTIGKTVTTGNLYAVWARFDEQNSNYSDIMFSRSRDCGATWDPPYNVSRTTGTVNQGAVVAVDPISADVYIAWRRVATATTPDAIMMVRSFHQGTKFTKPAVVSKSVPWEQPPGTWEFRTDSMPTMAISVSADRRYSWAHVAWQERDPATGEGRIMMSNHVVSVPPSTNDEDDDDSHCEGTWTKPVPIDGGTLKDDAGNAFAHGHQFMPQLTFSQGRLVAVYYDTRLDQTKGYYTPHREACAPGSADLCIQPNARGNWYDEQRGPYGAQDSWKLPFIADFWTDPVSGTLVMMEKRHTVDVRVATASAGLNPTFTSNQLSRLAFGERGDEASVKTAPGYQGSIQLFDDEGQRVQTLQQLQANPPNLPIFKQGTRAFIGDYIDVQGPAFVKDAAGKWQFNVAGTSAPVFHAVWTSNQDVKPPPRPDLPQSWQRYSPPKSASTTTTSHFDPSVTIADACRDGSDDYLYTGTRNQNVYSARITEGIVVAAEKNLKQLLPPTAAKPVRTFVVSAQNMTPQVRTFRFQVTARDAGTSVSLKKFDPPADPAWQQGLVGSLDVKVNGFTRATQTVFAVSTVPNGAIDVTVTEQAPCGSGTCLSGVVTLNPPGLNPDAFTLDELYKVEVSGAVIVTPGFGNAGYMNAGYMNAGYMNAAFMNAGYMNAGYMNAGYMNAGYMNAGYMNMDLAAFMNAGLDAAYMNAGYMNAGYMNAGYMNAGYMNAGYMNAAYMNAGYMNAAYMNAPVSDLVYTTTNVGSVDQSLSLQIASNTGITGPLKVFVAKYYAKPAASGCSLVQTADFQMVANGGEVVFDAAGLSSELATFAVAPGESMLVVIRGPNTTLDAMHELGTRVAPVISSQAAPETKVSALIVKTDVLVVAPSWTVGVQGTAELTAQGGVPPYTWSVGPVAGGTLPGTATLIPSPTDPTRAILTLTPSQAGQGNLVVQVRDSSAAPGAVSVQTFTIDVAKGTATPALQGPVTSPAYGSPFTLGVTMSTGSAGGTVSLHETGNATAIATATLSGGSASFTLGSSAPVAVGPHTYQVAYSGDSNFNGTALAQAGAAGTATVDVVQARPTVTVTRNVVDPVCDQLVTFTVAVTPPGLGTPGGTVTLNVPALVAGASSTITTTVDPSSGPATVTVPMPLSSAAWVVTWSYSGDTSFLGSTGSAPLLVGLSPTATVLAVTSGTPAAYGGTVGLQATVTAPASAAPPSGNVTFDDNGGATVLPAELVVGLASASTASLGAGTHSIVARFDSADGCYASSTSAGSALAIVASDSRSLLILNPAQATPGGTIAWSCAVEPVLPAGVLLWPAADPTGSVTLILDGGAASVAGGTLTNAVATGSYVVPTTLGPGTHSLGCAYGADANFKASASDPVVLEVNQLPSKVMLAADPTAPREKQTVTLTATVVYDGTSTTAPVPTGSVTFKDGATALGTVTLVNGVATLAKVLSEGSHTVTAYYQGDATYTTSASAPLVVKVLEDYDCDGYHRPLKRAGTKDAPSDSGSYPYGKVVPVRWSLQKPTGTFVSRPTAIDTLQVVYDSTCTGRPAAGARTIVLYTGDRGPQNGSSFAYDTSANEYVVGWNTTRGASKGCWDVMLTLDNGIPTRVSILKLQ